MTKTVRDVLHDVHTATNDILEGYDAMLERAEPEIEGIISDAKEMHERHAAEQREHLLRLGEDTEGDASLQGTMNKAVVTARDWVSDLDGDALSSVRKGEEALIDIYDEAIAEWPAGEDPVVSEVLSNQFADINQRIDMLQQA